MFIVGLFLSVKLAQSFKKLTSYRQIMILAKHFDLITTTKVMIMVRRNSVIGCDTRGVWFQSCEQGYRRIRAAHLARRKQVIWGFLYTVLIIKSSSLILSSLYKKYDYFSLAWQKSQALHGVHFGLATQIFASPINYQDSQ